MKWNQFVLALAFVAFSQVAVGEDKDPVCGIFKRVVKTTSQSPRGSVTTVQHTGYVFMADGTGYIYYWDNQTKRTTSGPDITWQRIGRGEYRYHRTWTEHRADGKQITKREVHPFSLSDDGDKIISPNEPPHREVPNFSRVN